MYEVVDNGKPGVESLVASGDGSYKMTRTVNPSDPNKVTGNGRKIIFAWLDFGANGQSSALPRDISIGYISFPSLLTVFEYKNISYMYVYII